MIAVWPLQAQVSGGKALFEMLRVAPSARSMALGGFQLSVVDDDVTMAWRNPGALNSSMHGRLSYQHILYYADITGGQFGYAHKINNDWTVAGGMQFFNYGSSPRADAFGNISGQVEAADYALWASGSRAVYEKLRVGATIRFASSVLDTYRASALMSDVSAVWQDTVHRRVVTFAVLNAGAVLDGFVPGTHERLPLEVQLGFSQRLAHLPFRLGVQAHHLQQWNLRYNDRVDEENVFGTPTETSRFNELSDNFFRHLIFGGEFLLGPRELFRLRLGYNHMRRKELSVSPYRSMAGFSAGVGFRLSKFRLDYGLSFYHIAGPTHVLGISSALSEFTKKSREAAILPE